MACVLIRITLVQERRFDQCYIVLQEKFVYASLLKSNTNIVIKSILYR